ncbi:hypothetical protein N9A49_01725 [Salibacteraceae bacterium]|jgi:arsenate reductase (glutaredoxin)|nr:hypothetical protein [Salibacteraceae bacterium]HAQ70180.1 arsenate reductase [Flavobacteriales bacterium]
MNKIYYLATCDTCKRIMKETGTDGFELQDIKQEHISKEELDKIKAQEGSYEAIFNKRAIKFREQGWNKKLLTDDQLGELILTEYTFLRRPIYMIKEKAFIGNSKKNVSEIKAALSE